MIAAVLWHVLIAPYLVGTAIMSSIPTLAAVGLAQYWMPWGAIVAVGMFIYSVRVWWRLAVVRWLWRRFIGPVDATLSGREFEARP